MYRNRFRGLSAGVCAAVLAACAANAAEQPNILLIVADDLGVEPFSMYGARMGPAHTPNLERLAQDGVRFTRFWAQPLCSPTRAALLTGRHAYRTGVFTPLFVRSEDAGLTFEPVPDANTEADFSPMGPIPIGQYFGPPEGVPGPPGTSPDEVMLPALLDRVAPDMRTAHFGKWHLGDANNGLINHPNLAGFDHYSGAWSLDSFYSWPHVENGEAQMRRGYVDAAMIDDAIAWIAEAGEAQWFASVNFMLPHTPYHKPPEELLTSAARDLDPHAVSHENSYAYFLAMIEAMDTLIGRLVTSLPEETRRNTYVIFIGDNGTQNTLSREGERLFPPERGKASTFEDGVNVPALIAGPGVEAGRVDDSILHVVDLYATIAELAAGAMFEAALDERPIDSVSFAARLHDGAAPRPRDTVLAESALRSMAVRGIANQTFKLVRAGDEEHFYNLADDPLEERDLLEGDLSGEALASYEALKAELDALPSPPAPGGAAPE